MNEEWYEKIEDYIKGKLPEQEKAAFEQQLSVDQVLAEEVALYRDMMQSVSTHADLDEKKAVLQQTLDTVGAKYFNAEQKPQARIIPLRRRALIAITGVAAAILLALFFWPQGQSALYDQYAQHPTAAWTEMGDASPTLLQQAEQAYNDKDYAQANRLLQDYLVTDPDNQRVLFYKGICALELDNYDAAIEAFDEIHSGSSAFQSNGTWYLALTYLKQNQKDKVIEYLVLIGEESAYYGKAKELMDEL